MNDKSILCGGTLRYRLHELISRFGILGPGTVTLFPTGGYDEGGKGSPEVVPR